MENKMTPAWVVENYLPDYERKKKAYANYCRNAGFGFSVGEDLFDKDEDNFHEALVKLLKAQREECAEAWHAAIALKGEPYYESICKAILEAPVPEPKNREI